VVGLDGNDRGAAQPVPRDAATLTMPERLATLRADVSSMIGETFEIEEIDEYGQPWVTKWWRNEDGNFHSHCVALAPHEMESVVVLGNHGST